VADAILVLNAGSSSIKFSLFLERSGELAPQLSGLLEGLYTAPRFSAKDAQGAKIGEHAWGEGKRLGHDGGLFSTARWPSFDPAKTLAETVEIAIQVNGKLRGRLPVDAGASEADVRTRALALDNVARHVADRPIAKAIFVPDKLLNLVLGR